MQNFNPLPSVQTTAENIDFVRELVELGASFLIIGGAAVAVHGCRPAHEVDDLDLLVEPTMENAEKVMHALAAIRSPGQFEAVALTRPRQQISKKDHFGYFDVLTPEPDARFADMVARSIPATLRGIAVRVAGREDIIVMKRLAVAREQAQIAKHQRDLECLLAAVRG